MISPEIRRLRVRFPSESEKHFSECAIRLEYIYIYSKQLTSIIFLNFINHS